MKSKDNTDKILKEWKDSTSESVDDLLKKYAKKREIARSKMTPEERRKDIRKQRKSQWNTCLAETLLLLLFLAVVWINTSKCSWWPWH